ncbi:carboxylesterase/lipase family protein [Phenylobacterium sp.]|uniref:carboxylesterase/lipase family protein n=1 Tax=Phenylobacterium sp. TaxID=1871053 RepID=UPI0035B0C950
MTESHFVEVVTAAGAIRGARSGPVKTFLGVPYGADTGGANRYRPPQPVTPWDGVRDALVPGHICPQVPPLQSMALRPDILAAIAAGYETIEGGAPEAENLGEDCLNLNVWSPAAAQAGAGLPVMVWIHGGATMAGSANLKRWEGRNLAARGDVVVVAPNHRLGSFGFAHLGALSDDPSVATAGVNGMLDLIQALEWVRENIAAFGGDPECVTIFGTSGGGFKMSVLLGMPAANGLYHRAIVQSGFTDGADPEASGKLAQRWLDLLQIEAGDLDALRAAPYADIIDVQQQMGGMSAGFAPVIDGRHLPEPATASIAAGRTGRVPLIAGYTQEEAATFLALTPGYGTFGWDALPAMLGPVLGDRAEAAVAVYRKARPQADPTQVWVGIMSDSMFGRLGQKLLTAHAGKPWAPTWAYLSTWVSSVLPDNYAAHGNEDVFFFDNVAVTPVTRDTEGAAELGRLLSEAWVTFARTGDPNHAGLPQWPRFDPKERATIIFDTPIRVARDPHAAERGFWGA